MGLRRLGLQWRAIADPSGEVDTRILHRLEGLEEPVGIEDIPEWIDASCAQRILNEVATVSTVLMPMPRWLSRIRHLYFEIVKSSPRGSTAQVERFPT